MSRTLLLTLFSVLAIVAVSISCVSGTYDDDDDFIATTNNENKPWVSYVSFLQRQPFGQPPNNLLTVSARLKVPKRNMTQLPPGSVPAVVIVHSSGTLDSRIEMWSELLNNAGIATIEIDLWATRGWFGGVTDRPGHVRDTLPDAYGALYFLAEKVPTIDKNRIGIMGFSWGGVVSTLSATKWAKELYSGTSANALGFAAHAPFYPVCWGHNVVPGYDFVQLTGKEILIQTGERDDYDTPTSCQNLIASLPQASQDLIELVMYPRATHAFDRLEPAYDLDDSYAHQGAGGLVHIVPNFKATKQAKKKTLRFFRTNFGMIGH